jgi:hypothetical protein
MPYCCHSMQLLARLRNIHHMLLWQFRIDCWRHLRDHRDLLRVLTWFQWREASEHEMKRIFLNLEPRLLHFIRLMLPLFQVLQNICWSDRSNSLYHLHLHLLLLKYKFKIFVYFQKRKFNITYELKTKLQ